MSRSTSSWQMILLVAALTLFCAEIPVFGLWLAPSLLLTWKQGARSAGIAVGLTLLLSVVLTGALTGFAESSALAASMMRMAGLGAIGLSFSYGLFRWRSIDRATLLGVTPFVVLVALAILIGLMQWPEDLAFRWKSDVVEPMLTELSRIEAAEGATLETLEQVATLRETLNSSGIWLLYLVPGGFGLVLIVTLWLNLWVARALDPSLLGLQPLSSWRPPDQLFWGMIVGGVLTLTRWTPLMAPGLNLLILGGVVYLLAGLTLLRYAAIRWKISWWIFLPIVALLLLSGGAVLLVLLGLLDFWLDIRTRWKQQAEQG